MKTIKNATTQILITALFFGLLFGSFSCSKSDSDTSSYVCETCANTPDALAANDGNVKGIYKGIVAGSTGTISIDIQNGSDTITATMILDGVTVALTSAVSIVDGQPYIAPFTGTFNGSPVTLHFSVGIGGTNPMIVTSDIPGHPNAEFEVFKETSTSLIEAFEGTYTSGPEAGVFNILLTRAQNKWGGVAKENTSGEVSHGSGTINANDEFIDEDGTVIGKISGDTFHGSFDGGDGNHVTLNGERTM